VERSYGLCIAFAFLKSIARRDFLFPAQQSDPPHVCGVSASSDAWTKPFLFATCNGVGDGADGKDEERHGSYDSQSAIDYTLQGAPVAANRE